VAAVAVYFGKLPTDLDQEQVHDYLFHLQKKSKTPSQSYFKHTVYGLRFLLKSGGIKKQMTLSHEEFIRRFALHILPKRYVKIRHCGFLSSTWKRQKLPALQEKMQVRRPEPKTIETLERICPCCKVGKLITIQYFDGRGPPKSDNGTSQTSSLKAENSREF
jgi:hypothetical protein